MRFLLSLVLSTVVAAIPLYVFAADNTSTVTGVVADKISIYIDPKNQASTVQYQQPLSIRFCDTHVILNYCTAPARPLKIGGMVTQGVKIEPAIEGEWRFADDYTLTFTPKTRWKADTNYTVTFLENLFPSQVELQKNTYDFTTAPLYLTSKSMEFFQDTEDFNKKLVNARLVFNYPVDATSVKNGLSFAMESHAAALPFTVGFSDDKTEANVTISVARLEKSDQFMDMTVQETIKAAGSTATLTRHPIVKPKTGLIAGLKPQAEKDNEFAARVRLPSIYDYIKINSTDIQVLKNAAYVPEETLLVDANAKISAKDIPKFLEVKLLPKDKPIPGLSPKKDYAWSSPNEITEDVRKTLAEVPFTLKEGDGDYTTLNAVTLNTEAGRYVLVKIKKGLPSAGGYELGEDYEAVEQIPDSPREIKIMAQGALLSLSGEKKLSIISLGVDNIQYKIGRVREENLNHLISQTRGNFSNPSFKDSYSFNEDNLSQIFNEEQQLNNIDPKKPNYSSFDFSHYLEEGKGLFFVSLSSKKEEKEKSVKSPAPSGKKHTRHHRNGANDEGFDSRFILVTDLGLIVKKNIDGTYDVFVQSISGNGPVHWATVDVLGLNGEPVAHVRTDWDGHAVLPNLEGMQNEKKPVAFVARKGDDLSFLPYDRQDREVNYSKFDVNGLKSTSGMNAYLFNDRGIYRPGETAHIGIIVKANDWQKTPQGLPLVLEITNPHGQVMSKQMLNLPREGLMSADFTTSETASTGLYTAALYLGRDDNEKGVELGSVSLRIEEFLPDRMKMTSVFTQGGKPIEGLAWVKPDQLTTDIELMMLYGAPAKHRRVTGKITLAPGYFGFNSFKDYTFSAGNNTDKSFDETLPETTTDDEGKAHLPVDLTKYKDSTFRMTFLGEGFEPDSGRSVKTSRSLLVSPLDYVLGVKQDSNLNYINPDDARSISLVAVNQKLAGVAANDLTVELKRIKTIQVLTKDGSGTYSYQPSTVETSLKTEPLQVPTDGLKYTLPTHDAGGYALLYKNAAGILLARVEFTVVGEANAAAGFTRDAVMMVMPDKPGYKSGDQIALNIQSPYTGTGLITIETDHVHAWKWFKTDTTSSTQTIDIPKGFEGKGFINVQFTRDLQSKEIFMSPFSFAVVPFTAGIDERDSHITLNVPKDVKPGDMVRVGYKTKKPAKIILYAVDEGILLYAHYLNPNPIEYFLMKRGLEVSTSQIMDLLLPEYSILRSLSQTGGDGFANDGKNLNPFKRKTQPPVAYWSGILDSSAEEEGWTFTVPSYFNGGVRIIAISAADDTMGTAQTSTAVHGPLMVTPNLPLFAAPGDVFTATATLTNNVKDSGKNAKVALAIEPSEQFEIIDQPKDAIIVPEGADVTVPVKLKATDKLGSGEIRFTAHEGDAHFTIAETTSIRPPMPSFTSLISGFAKDTQATVNNVRLLYLQFADMHASASMMPSSLIGGLHDYLSTYPYGCTEQVTSETFPDVVLYGNTELIKAFGWKSDDMEKGITSTFNQLRERQGEAGGFGMWSYYSNADGFVSAYAMHFLLEAKEKNLAVPEDVFEKGIIYLKNQSNEAPHSLEDAREKAYAIYLLTRAGEVTTNYIPHLTDYLNNYHGDVWHHDLVAVYIAATYKLMQMDPEANQLLDHFTLEEPEHYRNLYNLYAFYDSLTKYSQYVYILAKHFPDRLAKMDKTVIYRIANYVGEGSYNTVSSSYAVMALNAYITATKGELADITFTATTADGKAIPLTVSGEQLKTAQIADPVTALAFASKKPGFFYQVASSGYDKTLPDKPMSVGLELSKSYVGADGKPVQTVKLGDVVTVTRRKVLAGAAVLEWARKDSEFSARLMQELEAFLVRNPDRELFGLKSLKEPEI